MNISGDHMGVLQSILNLPDIFGPTAAMTHLRTTCSSYLHGKCTNAALNADPLLFQGLRDLLLSVFGDVPAVIACEERRELFCMLPRSAVFIWVKEDGLKVCFVNHVTAVLTYMRLCSSCTGIVPSFIATSGAFGELRSAPADCMGGGEPERMVYSYTS